MGGILENHQQSSSSSSSSRSWYCRRVLQRDGLRRRYLALLVPALAKVHAAYPAGGLSSNNISPAGQQQLAARARAVRRAADACLMQAMISTNTHTSQQQIGLHVRAARRTCSSSSSGGRPLVQRSAISYRLLRKAKAKYGKSTRRTLQRRSSTYSTRSAITTAAAAAQRINYTRAEDPIKAAESAELSAADHDHCWVPDDSELRRLQNVLFPFSSSSSTTSGAAAGDHHAAEEVHDPCNAINPAALLSQAALYIIALQVQVDALRSLANIT